MVWFCGDAAHTVPMQKFIELGDKVVILPMCEHNIFELPLPSSQHAGWEDLITAIQGLNQAMGAVYPRNDRQHPSRFFACGLILLVVGCVLSHASIPYYDAIIAISICLLVQGIVSGRQHLTKQGHAIDACNRTVSHMNTVLMGKADLKLLKSRPSSKYIVVVQKVTKDESLLSAEQVLDALESERMCIACRDVGSFASVHHT